MPSATRTIQISRPVSDVFAFFTEPANDPKWRPQVAEISAQGAPAVGNTVHQVIAAGPRKVPADIKITTYDPGAAYGLEVIAGPVRPKGTMTFADRNGTTEVTFSLSAELSGVKKLLMGKMVQKSMDGEMANLHSAKRIIEAG